MILRLHHYSVFFFFFNDTATPEIYPLPLHDALPISLHAPPRSDPARCDPGRATRRRLLLPRHLSRSEEHTSELQSRSDLVCRLLLEKKKTQITQHAPSHIPRAGRSPRLHTAHSSTQC